MLVGECGNPSCDADDFEAAESDPEGEAKASEGVAAA